MSAETIRTVRDGDPRTAMSAETIRTVRDGDPGRYVRRDHKDWRGYVRRDHKDY